MNWDAYYRAHGRANEPSPFALTVEPLFPRGARVIDIGCGDGHDARYFADMGHAVTALDASPVAVSLVDDPRVTAITAVAGEQANEPDGFDVAYLRWLLHAVTEEQQRAILKWCGRNANTIYIEARSDRGEHPTDHYRRPLNAIDLSIALRAAGYEALYVEEGYGYSKQGDDDPMLVRVRASLSSKNAGVLIPSDQRDRGR